MGSFAIDEVSEPHDVVIEATGRLLVAEWVADAGNDRLVNVSTDLKILKE